MRWVWKFFFLAEMSLYLEKQLVVLVDERNLEISANRRMADAAEALADFSEEAVECLDDDLLVLL